MGFRLVFSLNGTGIGGGYLNTHILFRSSGTDSAATIRFRNGNLRIVDCLCSRFFTKGHDVSGFVRNIRYIYVNQSKTDFFQFCLYVAGYSIQKFVTVRIDLFDVHRSDNETHLTENNILSNLLDVRQLQS